jgi:hypothetical protein
VVPTLQADREVRCLHGGRGSQALQAAPAVPACAAGRRMGGWNSKSNNSPNRFVNFAGRFRICKIRSPSRVVDRCRAEWAEADSGRMAVDLAAGPEVSAADHNALVAAGAGWGQWAAVPAWDPWAVDLEWVRWAAPAAVVALAR